MGVVGSLGAEGIRAAAARGVVGVGHDDGVVPVRSLGEGRHLHRLLVGHGHAVGHGAAVVPPPRIAGAGSAHVAAARGAASDDRAELSHCVEFLASGARTGGDGAVVGSAVGVHAEGGAAGVSVEGTGPVSSRGSGRRRSGGRSSVAGGRLVGILHRVVVAALLLLISVVAVVLLLLLLLLLLIAFVHLAHAVARAPDATAAVFFGTARAVVFSRSVGIVGVHVVGAYSMSGGGCLRRQSAGGDTSAICRHGLLFSLSKI
mmetsp:Transcript_11438/g.28184  ORF Transcript_11438/g.28184 Transcript_11438/m.28184 type:complete len:260 (-) Transcript_11438:169-948(-)